MLPDEMSPKVPLRMTGQAVRRTYDCSDETSTLVTPKGPAD